MEILQTETMDASLTTSKEVALFFYFAFSFSHIFLFRFANSLLMFWEKHFAGIFYLYVAGRRYVEQSTRRVGLIQWCSNCGPPSKFLLKRKLDTFIV